MASDTRQEVIDIRVVVELCTALSASMKATITANNGENLYKNLHLLDLHTMLEIPKVNPEQAATTNNEAHSISIMECNEETIEVFVM